MINQNKKNKVRTIIIVWIIILGIISGSVIFDKYFAIKDGEYYVNLFPEKSQSKNYRVPGYIVTDDYGFHLIEVYWPNGGTLSFEKKSYYTDLSVNEKVLAEDDSGDKWYVELTRDKVK